jgi:hypothetical protein
MRTTMMSLAMLFLWTTTVSAQTGVAPLGGSASGMGGYGPPPRSSGTADAAKNDEGPKRVIVRSSTTPTTRVYVRTVPEGANVKVDGKPVGQASRLITVPAGVKRMRTFSP